MKNLLEDIEFLEREKDFLISIKNLIEKNKLFETVPAYEYYIILLNNINKRIFDLESVIKNKNEALLRSKDSVRLSKKIILIILIPVLISIIILQYLLSVGNLSIAASFLIVFLLFFLTQIIKEYKYFGKSFIGFLFASLLIILCSSFFPTTKNIIDNYSGIITLLALIYAIIYTMKK